MLKIMVREGVKTIRLANGQPMHLGGRLSKTNPSYLVSLCGSVRVPIRFWHLHPFGWRIQEQTLCKRCLAGWRRHESAGRGNVPATARPR